MGSFSVVVLGGVYHGKEVFYVGSHMQLYKTPDPGHEAHQGYAFEDFDYQEWVHYQGFYVLKDSLMKPKAEHYRFTKEFQNPDAQRKLRHRV